MTNEHQLLACCVQSRESFERLSLVLESTDTLSSFGLAAWEEIKTYYATDTAATSVDLGIVKQRLIKDEPKKEYLIEEYLSSLPADVSEANVVKLYEDLHKDKLRQEIILALNNKDEKLYTRLIEELQNYKAEEKQEEILHETPIEELTSHFTGHNLIPLFPSAVGTSLGGGVPRQSQICIFARPDVGKSVAAINQAVGAAEAGFKVVYIGNEESSAKMMFRILTRFCRKPEEELKKDPKKYFNQAMERGYGNIIFAPAHPGNYKLMRNLIEKHKPDLVIVDQMRNMRFVKDNMVMNLEEVCKAGRNLAKEFNLVMCMVTQAGASAHDKIRLEIEDVEWSQTGVAAAMDLMLGFGQNQELKEKGLVVISVPKNKWNPIKPITANIRYDINQITVST